MKKLITGVIAAAAILFGFAGCAGDMHDDIQRGSTGAGSWYYISAGTPSSAPTLIFNNADKQTKNMSQTSTTGNVFFQIDTTKTETEVDYGTERERWGCEQIDEAAARALGWVDKNLEGLAIYVYAEIDPITKGLNIYSHTPECFGGWSGRPMSNDGAVLKDFTANVSVSFDVSAYEAANNATIGTIFVTGSPFGWKYPANYGWSSDPAEDSQFVAKDASVGFSYTTSAAEFPETTGEVQILLYASGVDAKTAANTAHLKQSSNFTIPLKDKAGTPYADFQNKRYENGATINAVVTVDKDGNVTAALK